MILENALDLDLDLLHVLVAQRDLIALLQVIAFGEAAADQRLILSGQCERIVMRIAEDEIVIDIVLTVGRYQVDAFHLLAAHKIP